MVAYCHHLFIPLLLCTDLQNSVLFLTMFLNMCNVSLINSASIPNFTQLLKHFMLELQTSGQAFMVSSLNLCGCEGNGVNVLPEKISLI